MCCSYCEIFYLYRTMNSRFSLLKNIRMQNDYMVDLKLNFDIMPTCLNLWFKASSVNFLPTAIPPE